MCGRPCGRELVECNELDTALEELAEYSEQGTTFEEESWQRVGAGYGPRDDLCEDICEDMIWWWEEQLVRVGIWFGVRTVVWKGADRV